MSEYEKHKHQCSFAMDNIGFQNDGTEIDSDFLSEVERILVNDDLKTLIRILQNKNMNTLTRCLLKAADIGTVRSVSLIIDQLKVTNKDVDLTCITGKGGNTVLHVAAESKSENATQIIELLFAKDLRLLEKENDYRRTPLHSAAYGQIIIVLKLCNYNVE